MEDSYFLSTELVSFQGLDFAEDCENDGNFQSTVDLRHDEVHSDHGTDSEENFTSSDTCWIDLHLSRPILKALSDLRFHSPTPIQKDFIPLALRGLDIIGTAETGSGKTAAFYLPVLERLLRIHQGKGFWGKVASKVLVLIPTRELAVQSFHMLESLAKYTPVTKSLIYGGEEVRTQEAALRRRPNIIVATTGRILDLLLNSQGINLELLEIIVLDEADRLMEYGFKEQCLQVLSHCSKNRQSLLLTATLSKSLSDFAELALKNPTYVEASSSNKVAVNLLQEFVLIPSEEFREAALVYLCAVPYCNKKKVVFFQTKKSVHRMGLIFEYVNMQYIELHGNLSQSKRLEALEDFKKGNISTLLASELVSRGLDFVGLECVINFNIPTDLVRYIHRVGRTARMGQLGKAVTLYLKSERGSIKKIFDVTKSSKDVAKKSTEVKDKNNFQFFRRKISPNSLMDWKNIIEDSEKHIKKRLSEEYVDRQQKVAESEALRAKNLIIYSDEIISRPKRTWYTKKSHNEMKFGAKIHG